MSRSGIYLKRLISGIIREIDMVTQNSPPSIDPADYGSLIGTLKHYMTKFTQNLDDQLPAKVIAYNAATNQAMVQPLVPFVTTDNQLVQRPQVVVPVRMDGAGGFVVYVQSRLPIDQATMNSDLPQYTAALRRERQNEAFFQWENQEAIRQLRSLPVFREQAARGAAK